VGPYWIDSNVFIEAHGNLFRPKIVPGFWKHIDAKLADGTVKSSCLVYRELAGYGDELSNWVKTRKQSGLCMPITSEVEDNFKKIAEYVANTYDEPNANEFLAGADGWVIAHAMATKGTVVSQESAKHPNARKARIPDVCDHFGVKCIKVIDMLEEQSAVL
jgi:hypothetical protein